jgi:hypothetical protein
MRATTLWLLALWIAPLAWAATDQDQLCFLNFDPRLADSGVPVLGDYAVDHGVCQGMGGIMAAFHEGARFAPEQARPATEADAEALLRAVMRAHAGGCGPVAASARVAVPGFVGLREFCGAFPRLFLREAVTYNASIATVEIAPRWPEFQWRKRAKLEDE